jgi:predicted MFS family arabinose efflux permease
MKAFRREFTTGYLDPKDQLGNISPAQSAQVVAILSAGTFFGALMAAPLGDRLGRRLSLIIAVAIFALGVLLQTIAMALPVLVSGRYVCSSLALTTSHMLTLFIDFLLGSVSALYLSLFLFINQRWLRNGFEEPLCALTSSQSLLAFFLPLE